ncbi:Undecaprenyl-phosphate galactosephosphotransferase [Streptococcus sp. DD10]|uniref:sugar transferase n=1 Tax=Streptococcus sp. DD10 TaxID=1777878 RepID=UPI000793D0BD|nr:sugar transferase [Streptococcus sp. DD10]KXT72767.1 Undecaprenyl-phosphate galactosephosphotransferase [Streptococcus sp. DD10]
MQEKLDIRKLEVAVLQLLVILLSSGIVFCIPDSDLRRNGIVLFGIAHMVVYYVGNYYVNFKYRGMIDELIQTIKYTVLLGVFVTFIIFVMDLDTPAISRRGLMAFLVVNGVLMFAANLSIRIFRGSIYTRRKNKRNILLVTNKNRLDKTMSKMSNNLDGQITAACVVDDVHFTNEFIKNVPLMNLISYATQAVVDEVFINLPSDKYMILDFVSDFEMMGIPVSVNINALNFLGTGEKEIHQLSGFSVVTFSNEFYNYGHVLAKRALDICGALVGLFFCGIAGIFLVPVIKRDGGPAIFVQNRVGQNGRVFKFYKFRSMRVDAEEIKKDLMDQNQMTGGMFKMDNDPRITPIGHFIRKTSLDELPQFWNVLKGDMSLVGTRPPTLDEYESYTPGQKRRLSFKPGITGLWQVSGRSEITDFDEVVKLDVAYMDGWTIWTDVKILLKTIKVVVMKDGAK